jgi:hypothetical protein
MEQGEMNYYLLFIIYYLYFMIYIVYMNHHSIIPLFYY